MLAVTRAPKVIWLTLFSGAMKYIFENSFCLDIWCKAYSTSTAPQMCCGEVKTQSMFMWPCRYLDSRELLITPLSPMNLLTQTSRRLFFHLNGAIATRTIVWRFPRATWILRRLSIHLERWPRTLRVVWTLMSSSRTRPEIFLASKISASRRSQSLRCKRTFRKDVSRFNSDTNYAGKLQFSPEKNMCKNVTTIRNF